MRASGLGNPSLDNQHLFHTSPQMFRYFWWLSRSDRVYGVRSAYLLCGWSDRKSPLISSSSAEFSRPNALQLSGRAGVLDILTHRFLPTLQSFFSFPELPIFLLLIKEPFTHHPQIWNWKFPPRETIFIRVSCVELILIKKRCLLKKKKLHDACLKMRYLF